MFIIWWWKLHPNNHFHSKSINVQMSMLMPMQIGVRTVKLSFYQDVTKVLNFKTLHQCLGSPIPPNALSSSVRWSVLRNICCPLCSFSVAVITFQQFWIRTYFSSITSETHINQKTFNSNIKVQSPQLKIETKIFFQGGKKLNQLLSFWVKVGQKKKEGKQGLTSEDILHIRYVWALTFKLEKGFPVVTFFDVKNGRMEA